MMTVVQQERFPRGSRGISSTGRFALLEILTNDQACACPSSPPSVTMASSSRPKLSSGINILAWVTSEGTPRNVLAASPVCCRARSWPLCCWRVLRSSFLSGMIVAPDELNLDVFGSALISR